jgi:hypothetical protein
MVFLMREIGTDENFGDRSYAKENPKLTYM